MSEVECLGLWLLMCHLMIQWTADSYIHQVNALLQLQELLEYPSATRNWNNNTNFCDLTSNPSLNLTCAAGGTLTYLRIVGDKQYVPLGDRLLLLHSITDEPAAAPLSHNNKSLSSDFNFSALIGTLLSFPDLQGIELVSVGLWGSLPAAELNQLSNLQVLNASSNLISGSVPQSLAGLGALRVLALDANAFTGSFPFWLSSNLVSLSLAHNQFTGLIPNFDSLVHLQSLNLGGNSFGPEFPSLGNKLVSVYLGDNQLAGPIPSSLKSLTELQTLDLSGNALSGNPPQFLFELPSIVFLSLARNHLSGILPDNLSLGPFLTFLDVSSNDLSGPLPKAFLSSVNNVTIKYQNNCLATIKQQQEMALYCSSATVAAADTGGHRHRHLAIIAAILGGGVGIGLTICVLSILLLKRWTKSSDEEDNNIVAPEDGCNSSSFASPIGIPSELLINARYIAQSKRLGLLPQPSRTFTLEELKEATNVFNPAAFVGEGSHGKVFKGQLTDKTKVAIKWITIKPNADLQEIKTQMDVLCKLRHHRHLVSILGYCIEENFAGAVDDAGVKKSQSLYVVSEFVEHGDHLRSLLNKKGNRNALSWSERLAAAIGAGRGIHHLHTCVVPPVFDNNLKSTNILLGESMDAQVSDYGILGHLSSFAVNNDKQDIYNYGLILLEMVLGRPPTIKNPFPQKRSELARPSMELIDKGIVGMCGAESLATVLEIAGKCMLDNPAKRPSMEDVLWNLQYAAQVHNSSAANNSADEYD
ncbi:unnamed protein product, partial [Sphagnum tenellum]